MSDRALDKAPPPVRARGVDAFAAPVRQRRRAARADELREPAGEISPAHVAVAGMRDPARRQPQAGAGGARSRQRARAEPPRRILEIEQAEIVLAALAHRRAAQFLGAARIELVEFAVDLALEVLAVGRKPNGPFVLVGPDAGGRDIAQRLAHPRSRLGQHHERRVPAPARREGERGGRGVVGLLRPRLRARAEQRGQPRARFVRRHRVVPRLRRRPAVGPFGEAAPHIQPAPRRRLHAERGLDRRAPHPAMVAHRARRGRGGGRVRVVGPRELAQERKRAFAQGERLFLERARLRQPRGGRQPARRRHAELRGADEREQFQRVVRREGRAFQPPRHRRQMADKRRLGARPLRRARERQHLRFAARADPRRRARPRRQRRNARQEIRRAGERSRRHERNIMLFARPRGLPGRPRVPARTFPGGTALPWRARSLPPVRRRS